MAFHMFSAKPFYEPMLLCRQLVIMEHTAVKIEYSAEFLWKEMDLKMSA